MRLLLFALALVVSETQLQAAERLPDGEMTRFGEYTAYLIAPTTRYQHGALGDEIEAGGFSVTYRGQTQNFMLPETQVFEDLRVRLHDLDDDEIPEAIIIRSDLKKGASIAVYNLGTNAITQRAESAFIGQANRWLNIVGFDDFIGNGTTTIGAVITPHLSGSLRLYEMTGDQLVELARIDGFTNHVNGTTNLDLADIRDVNGDGVVDIVLPTLDRSSMATITFKDGRALVLRP